MRTRSPAAPAGGGVREAALAVAIAGAVLFLNPHSGLGAEADRALFLLLPALVAAAAALWRGGASPAASGAPEGEPHGPRRLLRLLAALWAAWLVVAALAAPDPLRALGGELPRLQGALERLAGPLLFLSLAPIATPARARRWTGWLLAAAAATALHALLQAFGADPLAWREPDLLPVVGTQGNPLFLGLVLLVAVPLALGRLAEALARVPRGRAWVGAAALAAVLGAALLLTRGRGTLLGLLCALALLALSALGGGRRFVRPLLAGLLALALLGGGALAAGAFDGVAPAEQGTGTQRLLLWGAVRQLLAAEPQRLLTGWGPEGLALALPRHLPAELPALAWAPGQYHDRAHHLGLDLLAALGVPGLLLGLGLFAAGARLLLPPRSGPPAGAAGRSPASWERAALLAALGGLFVALQFAFLTAAGELLLWLLLLLALAGEESGIRKPEGAAEARAGRRRGREGGAAPAPRAPAAALAFAACVLGLLVFALRAPPQAGPAAPAWALLTLLALAVGAAWIAAVPETGGFPRTRGRGSALRWLSLPALLWVALALLGRGEGSGAAPLGALLAALAVAAAGIARCAGAEPEEGAGRRRRGTRLAAVALLALLVPVLAALFAGPSLATGEAELARGRPAHALPALERAARLAPWLATPRILAARAEARLAAAEPPGPERERRFAAARERLLAWRERRPLDPRLPGELGHVAGGWAAATPPSSRREELLAEAERWHRRALELAPASAAAHRNLALVLLDRGAIPEALALLERAVALGPRGLESWLLLARARLDAGEPGAARTAAARAVEIDRRRALDRALAVARAAPGEVHAQRDLALVAALAGETGLGAEALAAAESLAGPADRRELDELRPFLAARAER